MFDVSTILAPVDTSSSSLVALETAEYLTQLYSAKLHTAHIVSQIPEIIHQVLFPYAALGEDVGEFEEELINAARRSMRQKLGEDRNNGAHHPTSVLYGRTVDALHRLILSVGPDLVVMGARGEGGEQSHRLGSTSARILELCQRPVLFVREGAHSRRFDRVILATDLSRGSEGVLRTAIALSIRCQAPLTVATVLNDPRLQDGGRLLRGALRVDPNALFSRGKRNAEQQFRQMLGGIDIPYPDRKGFNKKKVGLTVLFGDPAKELQTVTSRFDAPLLVVGRSHQKDDGDSISLGRTADSIVRRVPTHVLVTPV